ncbi:IS1096 element passenger TnpR family protein [Natrinema gari]|uniref:Plasmid pRiA4b Orf3-like domain-containing protein n=1 Tax=Natrinema gari JCM 14663 TaxID=1230459 RepID=L9Z3K4_9EURY|nr:hypothetical protein [Natrinema gari]ELY80466.1 hypothetical protein C486_08685 [Natrinema gari JCM 14663]
MTAYRFRVKLDSDSTSLWRDIVVGSDSTLEAFQTTINAAMGLDQGHLWFFGTDDDYWRSDVKYQCSQEVEDMPSGEPSQSRRSAALEESNDTQRRNRLS